ncbi:MAG: glycosyltransferase [Pseudolabrys sp.]|nr:glycosyltransferase [Pseudolabrys sp.]
MKILHVLPAYLPAVRYGGPVFAVHSLCRELVVRGHDVEVITTNIDGPRDSDVPLSEPVWIDGVKVRYFASPALRRLFYAPAMAQALRHDMATFDVVHQHTTYLWPTWAAARTARAHRVPYVLSPRGMLIKDMIRRRSTVAKSLWIAAIERRNVERAAAVHVTSALEAAELDRFGWKLPPVIAVPNGVDEPHDGTQALPVAPDVIAAASGGPVVLYLGRISWKKGLDRLIYAFGRDGTGVLVIAGTDDEGLAPRLVALAQDLRIAERVRVLPRTIGGADKEYLFRAARVFVVPSLSENFGNTVLEAMRRRVPVVTTPEVGAAEIVRKAAAGIVTDGEPRPLSAAIAQLVRDPALARAMGIAGQRHAIAEYGWSKVAAEMERLYMSVARG